MSGPTLQLFPAPPPKNARPKRKVSRRNGTKAAPPLVGPTKSSTELKEIVIQVTEGVGATSRPGTPSRKSVGDISRSNSPGGAPSSELTRARSPLLTTEQSETASRPALSRSRATTPALSNQVSEKSNAAALVRSNSDTSKAAPINSIFPLYNPAIPLAYQNYRPTQASPTHLPPGYISKEPYSPSLYSAGSPGQASPGRGCLSAPSAITSFPAGVLGNHHRPQYSSLEELADLWEAANGQGTEETARTFALKMSREGAINPGTGLFVPTATESFTFGASKQQPFYDFQTLKANEYEGEFSECHIRRRDPKKGTVIPIMTFTLEPASRRESPQDGLVTNIYPKIAAMMALDSARLHQSSASEQDSASAAAAAPVDVEKLSEEALRRAARRESCNLFWDHDSQRYYLIYPGLNKGEGHRFVITVDPGVGFDVPGARGTIRLMDARSSSSTHETLVSLEFGTATLLIDTLATNKIPSFYMVDIAVSAVIAVALVEGRKARTTAITTTMSPAFLSTTTTTMAVPRAADRPLTAMTAASADRQPRYSSMTTTAATTTNGMGFGTGLRNEDSVGAGVPLQSIPLPPPPSHPPATTTTTKPRTHHHHHQHQNKKAGGAFTSLMGILGDAMAGLVGILTACVQGKKG